jgi:hypothetical protein
MSGAVKYIVIGFAVAIGVMIAGFLVSLVTRV